MTNEEKAEEIGLFLGRKKSGNYQEGRDYLVARLASKKHLNGKTNNLNHFYLSL